MTKFINRSIQEVVIKTYFAYVYDMFVHAMYKQCKFNCKTLYLIKVQRLLIESAY